MIMHSDGMQPVGCQFFHPGDPSNWRSVRANTGGPSTELAPVLCAQEPCGLRACSLLSTPNN